MNKLFAVVVLAGLLASCTKQDTNQPDTTAHETTLEGFARHDGIELRSAKGDHGRALETLGPSDDLEIFLPDPVPQRLDPSDWYRVKYEGRTGWIQGGNLFVVRREQHDATMRKYEGARTGPFIRGSYLSDYAHGVAPELELFQDGTFRLTINRCEGMTPVTGVYLATEDHIVLHDLKTVHQPVSRYWSTILDLMVVELARLESGDLLIENDLSYFDGFQGYGSCAPDKGETFMRGE
jgi:hypothetical protein